MDASASPRKPSVAMVSRSSKARSLEVVCLSREAVGVVVCAVCLMG